MEALTGQCIFGNLKILHVQIIGWRKKDKTVSLVLILKGPAVELLQKVPPDNSDVRRNQSGEGA